MDPLDLVSACDEDPCRILNAKAVTEGKKAFSEPEALGERLVQHSQAKDIGGLGATSLNFILRFLQVP